MTPAPATVRFDSAFSGSGKESLVRQIAALRQLAAQNNGGEYFVGASWKERATLDEVISHLESLRSRANDPKAIPGVGYANGVSGTSYVYPSGAQPPSTRQVTYYAYSICNGCNSAEFPEGWMTMQQFAGQGRTFYNEYHFSGPSNGINSGEYYTTVHGDPQTAYLSTDHYVEDDPGWYVHHYYSSSSNSV